MAGLIKGTYGYLDWIARQSVPFTSTAEYLAAWAALKGIVRKVATSATGTIVFTGLDTTPVPAGTIVSRSDGFQYSTDVDCFISGTTASTPVTALTTGVQGNSDISTLTISSAIAGVSSRVTSSILTGGSDIETDDSLRTRMLQVYASPPSGGNKNDYVEWASQVPGVTRAWTKADGAGIGTVVVYIMMDLAESAFNGFPQGTNGGATGETRTTPATGDQLLVANWIYPLRPVTALVICRAPSPMPIDIAITNLNPNTIAIQTAITQAIKDAFVRIGDPTGVSLYQSDLTTAIESVPGVARYTLSSPVAPTPISVGSLPTLGAVTYSA